MIWHEEGGTVAECDECKIKVPIVDHGSWYALPAGWYLYSTYDGLYTACSTACAEKATAHCD